MRPSEYLHQITSNGGAAASRIGELAGAEIKPAVKGLGAGSGLFAGAGFFAYTALKIFGLALGFLLAWVFSAVAGLSMLMSLFLGFLIVAVLTLVIVVVAFVMGKRQFKHVHAPTATIAEIKATLGAIGPAVADGVKEAEDALDAAKQAKASAKSHKPNFVRDPIFLAKLRRSTGTGA